MKNQEIVTTDFAKFGNIEREEAEKLLKAWRTQGLPEDFYDEDVTINMNTNSGYVFLSNSEYQVAMITDEDKLESFYSCPECGHEGFKEDMEHGEDNNECKEYVASLAVQS